MKALVVGAMFALTAFAGCAAEEKEGTIDLYDNRFEPEEATAKVGDSFTFLNEGKTDHTVTIHRPPDPATTYLKDTRLAPDADTTFTFDKAGTYHIWCTIHGQMTSGMHMVVTVPAS